MSRGAPLHVAALVAAAPQVEADARARARPLAQRIVAETGGVLLATCHRVEVYAPAGVFEDQAGGDPRSHGLSRLAGIDAARHIIDVAVGLDSAVLAEDQLIHQLRTAVAEARRRGPLGRDLDALLDAALRAGRTARSWRPASQGPVLSLADVALARASEVVGSLVGRSVLIVGSGVMGRSVASAAVRARARVHLTSPTESHAKAEAARVGAALWPMDPGARLADMDAILVALSGPWRLATVAADALATRPIVVDLSMPSALDPEVRVRLGSRLIDIDDLAVETSHAPDRDAVTVRYRDRLDRLAADTLAGYLEGVAARSRSGADRLAALVEQQRAHELEAYLRREPDMSPEVRRHLDRVTRGLSRRMFREPLRRLADDPDGRRRRAYDELFGA